MLDVLTNSKYDGPESQRRWLELLDNAAKDATGVNRAVFQKLVEKMESAGYQFWNDHVLPQCPPNPGPGDSDTASLKALYPSQVKPEEKIEPTATISELVAERFTLLPRMKKLKSRKQEIENLVRDHMKLKAFMEGDDWKAVWRKRK